MIWSFRANQKSSSFSLYIYIYMGIALTAYCLIKSIKVVVISRLVFRKGVDLLVGIIPAVCQRLDHVDFIIGGDGSRMLDLQEMVERERLEERVEFLFSVPHAQVRDVLVRGDVFLNCSLTESFCIAILEAASCGLLVVSTNVGGVPEVLPQDLIVLSEPNVPSMVDSLLCAIARQSESPLDAWKTHERVKQMYSWHRVAVETVQVYDRIAQLKRKTFLERLGHLLQSWWFVGNSGVLLRSAH